MTSSAHENPGWFGTTQWTQVIQARDGEDEAASIAMENLCRKYWMPLYGYIRRKGNPPAEAEDLTQGFFLHLLEKHWLASVDQGKGRFRTFLLVCLNNFLSDEHAKRSAQKRGGGRAILSLDWESAEGNYQIDPPDERSPEMYFEKKWATETLRRALHRLKVSYEESGRGELYGKLRPYLTGNSERGQFAHLAQELGMEETAVRVAVSRLRKRYRESLKEEVAETVASSDDADEEFRHVCQVLTGS